MGKPRTATAVTSRLVVITLMGCVPDECDPQSVEKCTRSVHGRKSSDVESTPKYVDLRPFSRVIRHKTL